MFNPFADCGSVSWKTAFLIGILILCVTMTIYALPAPFQSQSGRLSGRLYDPSGSPIENATISVFDPAKNVRDIVTSNASGVFEFSRLPVGRYELQTSAIGFESFQIHGVAVEANQSVNLNILSVEAAPVAPIYAGKRVQPVQPEKPGQSPDGITPPRLILKVDPIYPPSSQDQRIVATVLLDVVIGIDGVPESSRLTSDGVDPDLARAAIDAVKQWRYQPAMLNGRPLQQTIRTNVNFFNTEAVLHSRAIEPEINPFPSATPSGASPAPGENVQQSAMVSQAQPIYPSDAKAAGIQGSVVLEAAIGKEGDVQRVHVISGHPMLRQAAIDAVSQWKYRPTLLNGEPIEVVTTVTINFSFQ